MYDTHYDFLTFVLLKQNDIQFLKELCSKVYEEKNIKGGIINTFYMEKEKMVAEGYDFGLDVIEHFNTFNNIIDNNNLIKDKSKVVYAIEGCELINIEDLEKLYQLGLRCILPAYSHGNQYGGGWLQDNTYGLTELGKELIKKAVSLGIAIDISHSNDKTANDILDLILELKQNNQNPIVMASHSNARELCDIKRNLPDQLIYKLKQADGIIGVLSLTTFCVKSENPDIDYKLPDIDYRKAYMNQIKYIACIIGIDNVCIASDNMDYDSNPNCYELSIYPIDTIVKDIKEDMKKANFSDEEIEKIMITNFENKVLKKINKE